MSLLAKDPAVAAGFDPELLDAFPDLIDAIPAAAAIVDRHGRLTAVNGVWRSADTTSYPLIGQAFSSGCDYLALCDAAAGAEEPAAAVVGDGLRGVLCGAVPRFEREYVSGDRWFNCVVSRLRSNVTNQVVGALVLHQDISQRKQAEHQAFDTERRIRLIADTIPALVSYVDADLKFQFVNKRYEEWYRKRADQIIGKTLADLFGDAVFRAIGGHVAAVLAGEEVRFSGLKEDDGRWYKAHLVPHLSSSGRVLGYFATVYDVSDEKAIEERLKGAAGQAELANRAKSEFLASMSHELRTPLNAIIGFSDMILTELFGPLGHEKYLDYARDINESGKYLLSLINDVLDLSKIEAGKFELHDDTVDLGEMIESALRMIGERARRGGVALESMVNCQLPCLQADERLIRQMLLNFLSNAVKFTPSGGIVTVTARLDAGDMVISVKDSGIGIAPEHIAKVLEPFGQVDTAVHRREAGTGLGLPLSKRFVELHGGTLTLTSAVGQGTTVVARFPAERVASPD